MKQFVTTAMLATLCAATANAQSFTDRLQKQVGSQGKVTVTQSADIDELVNGTKPQNATTTTQNRPTESASPKNTGTMPKSTTATQKSTEVKPQTAQTKSPERQDQHTATKRTEPTPKTDTTTADTEPAQVDMRPKVMEKSYKTTGYRVQAFAGGNTRADKQKAQRIGNDIKMNFPNEPVYVHFYSPRWICRVGNYRSMEEANKMLYEIRKLGYKQALIVKGKITVQY